MSSDLSMACAVQQDGHMDLPYFHIVLDSIRAFVALMVPIPSQSVEGRKQDVEWGETMFKRWRMSSVSRRTACVVDMPAERKKSMAERKQ